MKKDLSPTQEKVLRFIKSLPNQQGEIGGNARIHFLSAARALVKKGILIEYRSSAFALRDRQPRIRKPSRDGVER